MGAPENGSFRLDFGHFWVSPGVHFDAPSVILVSQLSNNTRSMRLSMLYNAVMKVISVQAHVRYTRAMNANIDQYMFEKFRLFN